MPQRSSIEWTDWTANPIKYRTADGKTVWACVKHSPGCANCYSEALAKRYGRGGPFTRQALEQVTPFACEEELRAILRSKPMGGQRCFIGDMTDVFGEWVTDWMLDQMFAVFALRRDVTFQVLTKRADRMRDYLTSRSKSAQHWKDAARSLGWALEFEGYSLVPFPLPNVWLGVSVEDQQRADERILRLIGTPAAVRLLSCEPLLGPVDLCRIPIAQPSHWWIDSLRGVADHGPKVNWVIVGGESGPNSRPFDLRWAESIVRQCRAAGVPVFVKQLGSRPVSPEPLCPIDCPCGLHHGFASRKGGDPDEWPADLRVRQFPETRA